MREFAHLVKRQHHGIQKLATSQLFFAFKRSKNQFTLKLNPQSTDEHQRIAMNQFRFTCVAEYRLDLLSRMASDLVRLFGPIIH
jgi:hypothetical protein